MGCTTSTAKAPTAAEEASPTSTAERHTTGAGSTPAVHPGADEDALHSIKSPAAGSTAAGTNATTSVDVPNRFGASSMGEVASAAAAATAAAEARAAKARAAADPNDCSIGTEYQPPPGGRTGCSMVGGPPTNLLEVPGTPCEDGLVARPPVTLRSGAVYEGQWKDMQRTGVGVLTWPTGEEYRGQLVGDRCQGEGTWKDGKGNIYEGQWKDNKLDGHGTFLFADGTVYTGKWKGDLKDGPAKEVWGDGTVFEGQFKDGDRCGKGRVTFPSGSVYEGTFAADQFEGNGEYTWPNGRVYKGQWKGGHMHGKGEFSWPDGQMLRYEGEYENGMRHGKGRLYLRDGRYYEGGFVQNKMEGEITEVSPSGNKRVGIWEGGKNVKWLNGPQKFDLGEPEETEANVTEYQTTVFSNPSQYQQMYKSAQRARAVIPGGIFSAGAQRPSAKTPAVQNAQLTAADAQVAAE